MRYLATLFWTLILVHMLMYVAGSMLGASYDFGTATILGIIAFILVMIVSAFIPEQPAEEQ
ncbi:YjzD family protein [Siminovitchia sediminis]|uniref:YjzD family protein n=1 Tax=Siminovitchia sediminis TaxID=1274353 RepID=A0ABW4KL85_9BACI